MENGRVGNENSNWITLRGSWVTHVFLLITVRLGFACIPFISTEAAWTLTTLTYNIVTYTMFHGMIGTPFDYDQNELGGLTLWEQMENSEQFTPTKKYLTAVPIVLFLLSTHYTHYDLPTFLLNLASTLLVVIAKAPQLHKTRFFGINKVE